MNCEIDWDRGCGPHAAAHLLAAVRNAEFFAADASADRAPTTTETAAGGPVEPLSLVRGEVHLPESPGLGLRLTDPTLVA
jgi:L-alanine-DL-glutamate epimerase-like enolase superfamily enzyme